MVNEQESKLKHDLCLSLFHRKSQANWKAQPCEIKAQSKAENYTRKKIVHMSKIVS